MKTRELINLGVPRGPAIRAAQEAFGQVAGRAGVSREAAREQLVRVLARPEDWVADESWRELALLLGGEGPVPGQFVPRQVDAPFRMWGTPGEDFDEQAVQQLRNACAIPVAAAGALMPDAHVGYGLPIGGVLATKGAVIPYAVGVDIACRMKLSVLDLPATELDHDRGRSRLTEAIERETRFGMGAAFGGKGDRGSKPRRHPVMDMNWSVSPITQRFKDKAYTQLGTSGSGNHFVEFGTLTIQTPEDGSRLGLAPGVYLALLSHSGSRGTGASVCDHYSRLAMEMHPDLPKQLRHLAWLDLQSQEGREYWDAMNLMGEYAAANHACIHEAIARHLGVPVIAGVENHHNFAWKERHVLEDGAEHEVIVHRKGATPAGAGVLGVIPGSMAQPGYVVVGRDGPGSLSSASHGAGRVMSRSKAKETFRWAPIRKELAEKNVTLISAGIDENPHVYKDIRRVIAQQRDLVTPIARFDPRLVKMAPEGEKAED